MSRYDLDATTIRELLSDPDAAAIIERRHPGLTTSSAIKMVSGLSVRRALVMAQAYTDEHEINEVVAELGALD